MQMQFVKEVAVCVWHIPKDVHSVVLTQNSFFFFPSVLLTLQSMVDMGNTRARQLYEAHLPENFRRPQTDQYPLPACSLCLSKTVDVDAQCLFNSSFISSSQEPYIGVKTLCH